MHWQSVRRAAVGKLEGAVKREFGSLLFSEFFFSTKKEIKTSS